MPELTTWPSFPFTLGDLAAVGIPAGRLRRALKDGEVRVVVRGVYVLAAASDSVELRCQAVARVVKPHHVVTDRTAAWIHGVDVFVWAEHDVLPDVEMCALRGHEP